MTDLRYLYFPGCKMQPFLPAYDLSVRAVAQALDMVLEDCALNCCGYPVRHRDFVAAMLCGARILAVAAGKQLPLLTPCKCCYGNLRHADYWLRRDTELRARINALLAAEGLAWQPEVRVLHLLTALKEDVGFARLADRVRRPLTGLRAAVHYGCHALRPGDVTGFDNPLAPTIFESLVTATGARAVQWPLRLDCCGSPLWDKNTRVSLALLRRKRSDARACGADVVVTACTYCQLQFNAVGRENADAGESTDPPAVLYTHLLGAALGCLPNVLDWTDILEKR